MKFSQRIGKTTVREALQVESIDTVLENRLWNDILQNFFSRISDPITGYSPRVGICKTLWTEFFNEKIDEIPSQYVSGNVSIDRIINFIKKWFFEAEWYEKYDLIEYLSFIDSRFRTGFIEACNFSLKKESAGYRIIDNKIVQITSEEEITEIEKAINSSDVISTIETHLKTALEYLSNREKPDYRNSIKESISAVESLCIIMTGDKNATLGKALAQIEKKYKLHGALKNAFSALYGYTSDSGGIRHSLLEDDIDVTLEDAKFMLVSCSAFINYLKSKK